MFTRIAVLTALSLTFAACGGGEDSLKTPTQLQPVTTAPAPNVVGESVVVAETSTTTTTIDLSGVNWEALAEAERREQEITRQMEIDEARMVYGRCGEWHDVAMSVGWTEAEWPMLSRVIYRESRCQPDAWNGADSGLTQINQVHREWASQMGLDWPDQFFDPSVNLLFAYRLWSAREQSGKCGWQPWSLTCD